MINYEKYYKIIDAKKTSGYMETIAVATRHTRNFITVSHWNNRDQHKMMSLWVRIEQGNVCIVLDSGVIHDLSVELKKLEKEPR